MNLRPRHRSLALSIAMVLALGACRSVRTEVRRDASFRPSEAESMRVVILPFEDSTGGVSPLLYPALPLVWTARLITLRLPAGVPEPEAGARALRPLLAARLAESWLNVVDAAELDALTAAERAGDPLAIGRRLQADAVLTGRLESWGSRYYVLEAHNVVEASVVLRSVRDGRELFSGRVRIHDASGLTQGPTGYISLATAPLAALGNDTYGALAVRWGDRMGAALLGEVDDDGAPERAPAATPVLDAVAISEAPAGGYSAGERITVSATGTAGMRATFDFGAHRRIPMAEVGPADETGGASRSLYRGSYLVTAEDRRVKTSWPIVVTLAGDRGSKAKKSAERTLSLAAR